MKIGRSGAPEPGKATKSSDAGTGDLGLLPTLETPPCLGDAGSAHSSIGSTLIGFEARAKLARFESTGAGTQAIGVCSADVC